ncbi:MAG: chromosomal replication initiator protein DnaA [Candidatus Paceibacterota bacterium]
MSEDNKKLWESVLAEIELAISKPNFSMWFKDTLITKQEGGVVFVGVPNVFVKDWLINKYHKNILKSLRGFGEHIRGVEYLVVKHEAKKEAPKEAVPTVNPNELPLQDFYINKEDNLNPKYTFETFVVGPFNELAYAATQAIIKRTAIYNPLFVYGGTGHGKTHLIQAVGNHIKQASPNKKIYYLTSEKFAVDLMNSISVGSANLFKEKYRKYDVLIVDDIQFFAGKQKTEEEFFHLFNSFYDNNKQIIFSSDKHPNFIQGLEDRLKSRLNSGMIVEIPSPDLESRIQIFRIKSNMMNFSISPETTEYLASSVEGNIRELEGVLNSIICQSKLKGRDLTINEIKDLIKNNLKPKKTSSIKDVVKTIAEFYGITEAEVYEKTRKKSVVKPRQVIMYLLREDFDVSYPTIGEKLGGKDHTTVMHSYEKVKEDLKTDSSLIREISQLRSMLN